MKQVLARLVFSAALTTILGCADPAGDSLEDPMANELPGTDTLELAVAADSIAVADSVPLPSMESDDADEGAEPGGMRALPVNETPPPAATPAAPPRAAPAAPSAPPATPPAPPASSGSSADPLTVYSGVYTRAQATRGNQIQQRECSSCHSPADWSGGRLVQSFTGRSVFDLVSHIRNTMPMDSPGRLTMQEYTDIVAYVLQLNSVPAGDEEMKADEAELRAIRVEYRR